MKIACIQPKIDHHKEKCYIEIERLLNELINKHDKSDMICLPERWIPLLNDRMQNIQKERGEDYAFIKKLAKEYHVNILSGAIWEKRNDSEKLKITCYFINVEGEEIGRQDKIHLYGFEKEYFEPGKVLKLFNLNKFLFAILICFDMAFFETPRLAAENGADILFSPTQIKEEGMDNWSIYLQARALENRIPIAASNTCGNFLNRNYPGNSKIISFIKGNVSPARLNIVEGPIDASGFVYDDIDLLFPKKIRKIRLGEKIEKNNIKIEIIAS